jgi:signal peptidase
MDRSTVAKIYPIVAIVAIFILNYLSLLGFFNYTFSIVFFTLIGLIGYYLIRKFNFIIVDKRIILVSVVSGVVQILISVFIAFFTGFGGSPYVTSALGIINNILFFTTNLFGFELLRSFILLNLSIKNKLTLIVVTAVVITFASLSLPQIIALNSPLSVFDYIGSNVLPSLSQNGLATLLAFTGGPFASLGYRLTITAFEWLSPILPDFSWILKTALGAALPVLGLFIFTESANKQLLVRKGLISRRELRLSSRTKKGELGWFIVLVVSITLVWGSLGLFGPKPEVIASGSMTPTLNVGDIVIVTPTTSKDLVKGEIISYYREDLSAPVIHRVVNLSSQGGDLLITTKGDANNAEDVPFSASSREVFKTILVVPKIGWVSIFLKEIPSMVSSYVGK